MAFLSPTFTTSTSAHAFIVDKAARMRFAIWKRIVRRKKTGATCDEIEVLLHMRHQTASARINELMNAKAIVDRGVRRKTRSGCKAIVWFAAGAKA